MWCLFPWIGSYAFLALERFIRLKCAPLLGISGINSVRPYYICFKMTADKAAFFKTLSEEAAKSFDPMDLIYPNENPVFEKYDEYVPDELVRKGFAFGILGIDEMKKRIKEWNN